MTSTYLRSFLTPIWLFGLFLVITFASSLQSNIEDDYYAKYSTATAIDAVEADPVTESKHSSALKMKNGFGGAIGFNQLKLNYGATLATNTNHNRNHYYNHHHHNHPASLNKNINPNLANTINGNNNNQNNNNNRNQNQNQPQELNPHLEVSLIDVEPEGNLFLDETYFQTADLAATSTTTTAATIVGNKRLFTHSIKPNDNNGSVNVNDNFNNARTKTDPSQPTGNKFVDIRHFALTHSLSSATLRATYGPFSIRKTLNPFSVRRNNQRNLRNDVDVSLSNNNNTKKIKNIANNRYISEQINAYLVTKEVRRSHPVLRVLFFASHLFELRSSNRPLVTTTTTSKSICAIVIVQHHGERLFGTCSPNQNPLNACLAEIVIPALYWPPLDVTNGGIYAAKQQKSSIAKVFYTIIHVDHYEQCNDQNFLSLLAQSSPSMDQNGGETVSDLFSAENIMNLVHLSDVFLVPFRGSYEEVTNDNVVTILIPQEPVYPNSKIYIPVKYTYNPEYPVSAFSLRVQVKPGLRILGAQLSHPNKLWQLSIELGPGQTTATVTAFLREYDQNVRRSSAADSQSVPDELLENVSQEVYSWLIEVNEDINISELNGRIVWQLLYETETAGSSIRNRINEMNIGLGSEQYSKEEQQQQEHFDNESVKLTSLIDIQKDVMEEIVAITNTKELINTAILNGRQVLRSMRIYQVSAAGQINDITFQCSCQSMDESIIKVSSSCTTVYLDGSELRGSQNATITIKYGSYIGQGNFVVWMPMLPLEVRVTDEKLSQIEGWRVHRQKSPQPSLPFNRYGQFGGTGSASIIQDRFDLIDEQMLSDWADITPVCQLKFQQARIEVFTRYQSSDHDSGREASLVNRKHLILITNLVRNFIRVSDKKVLTIRGNIVEGVSVGRADIEVISPITGAVIGSKQIEVNLDKESITKMQVRLVSGIKMAIEPYRLANHQNIWMVKTNFIDTLTKQYQEALLDTRLYFSDQTSVYLSEISPNDYHLSIKTLKGVVDNVTRTDGISNSIEGSSFLYEMPRIIALMPGQGELIHTGLEVIPACQQSNKKQQQPLASTYVSVDVNFELPERMFALQNDAIHYRRYGTNFGGHHTLNQTSKNGNEFTNKLMIPLSSYKKKLMNIKDKTYHNHNHDYGNNNNNGDNIKYQRHSISTSSGSAGSNAEEMASMKFGILSLISIICIACIIIIIYSILTAQYRARSGTPTFTTKVIHDRFKSSINAQGRASLADKTSATAVRNWVWISKEELENESKFTNNNNNKDNITNNNSISNKLLAPLLPANNYLPANKSTTTSGTNMNIIINPNDVEIFSEQQQQQLESEQHPNGHRNNKHEGLNRNELVKNKNADIRHDNDLNINDNGNDIDLMISTKSNAFVHLAGRISQPTTKQLKRTRHLPIPKKDHQFWNEIRKENLEWNKCTPSVPPPVPMHRKRQHRAQNRMVNENFSRFQKSNPMNSELEDSTPPPVPAHQNLIDCNAANNDNQRAIRPKKLSLKLNKLSSELSSNEEKNKPFINSIDYRSMGKLLTKLKESQA